MQSVGSALYPPDAILAPGAALRYRGVAMPVPLRQQLEEAAIDCRSVTFHNGASRTQEIKRVAFEVGGQFRRAAMIEVNSRDVVVSFILSAA
jgi:hypothetical protein